MPTISTSNYEGLFKATIEGTLHGQLTNNVMFFSRTGELGTPDWTQFMSQLAADIISCITTTLLPAVSSQWTFVRIKIQRLDGTGTDENLYAAPANSVGAGSESLPSTVAAVLSIRTGLRGRSKRGRMYLGGLPESGQATSALTPGQLVLVAAFATCLIDKFINNQVAGDAKLGVYSRKLGGTQPYSLVAGWYPATTIIAQGVLGTMRSRMLGRGA